MAGKRKRPRTVTQPQDPSYRFIGLTKNQIAVVDACDFELLNQFCWHARWHEGSQTFYAARWTSENHNLYMHQVICGRIEIDHADGDGLNNRRSNLRPCTRGQNNSNRKILSNSKSGYKGIYFMPVRTQKPWMAKISVCGKRIYLGVFASAEEAARAYDVAAKEKFGEFANLNFPLATDSKPIVRRN